MPSPSTAVPSPSTARHPSRDPHEEGRRDLPDFLAGYTEAVAQRKEARARGVGGAGGGGAQGGRVEVEQAWQPAARAPWQVEVRAIISIICA